MTETRKTILEKFLAEKTSEFSPVPRRGVPRGELVGLRTLTKYKVALLLAVTKLSPKQIGVKLNIPAQTIRLYANQSAFKLQMGMFHIEFAKRVLDAIQQGVSRDAFCDQDFYSKEVLEYIKMYAENIRSRNVQIAIVDIFGSSIEIQFMNTAIILDGLVRARKILAKRRMSWRERFFVHDTVQSSIKYILAGGD